ncbi:hypothetical protein NDU88_006614 [Pleurodeles waltl]|uniref:Uncharacterized protein n=1 Tax=Pleurodeles waltl TaxID=8319 RepID=A0AAV7TXN2_PLEWA|nr:hypothetical protein NDU88_006614 [Pleurodeles waltl]
MYVMRSGNLAAHGPGSLTAISHIVVRAMRVPPTLTGLCVMAVGDLDRMRLWSSTAITQSVDKAMRA